MKLLLFIVNILNASLGQHSPEQREVQKEFFQAGLEIIQTEPTSMQHLFNPNKTPEQKDNKEKDLLVLKELFCFRSLKLEIPQHLSTKWKAFVKKNKLMACSIQIVNNIKEINETERNELTKLLFEYDEKQETEKIENLIDKILNIESQSREDLWNFKENTKINWQKFIALFGLYPDTFFEKQKTLYQEGMKIYHRINLVYHIIHIVITLVLLIYLTVKHEKNYNKLLDQYKTLLSNCTNITK